MKQFNNKIETKNESNKLQITNNNENVQKEQIGSKPVKNKLAEERSPNNIQQLTNLIENVHIECLLQDQERQQDKDSNNYLQNLYYRTQPVNQQEQLIQFNSLLETQDLVKNRETKSACLQKYNNLIAAIDNKTENNFGIGLQRLISPVKNNANCSINFGQSMKLINMNRGIALGQEDLAPFNNTDQKTQLNLMVDHQTNSIGNFFGHQNIINRNNSEIRISQGLGTCLKINNSNKSSSNITSKNRLTQAINEQKVQQTNNQLQENQEHKLLNNVISIPSPINGSENLNYGSYLTTQNHQNIPNGAFLKTGMGELNNSFYLNQFNYNQNQLDDEIQPQRSNNFSCYKNKEDQRFQYQNYLNLLNLSKNQQLNTINFVERAYRLDKFELKKQNALLQQRVDQQKQEIDQLNEKGEKNKMQYEKIIEILRKNKKQKKIQKRQLSENHSFVQEENYKVQKSSSDSSSDSKSYSNISQLSLKLIELQQEEVKQIRKLYENNQKQNQDKFYLDQIKNLNEQIQNLKISQERENQIKELRHKQEIQDKNQQIINIEQQLRLQKLEHSNVIQEVKSRKHIKSDSETESLRSINEKGIQFKTNRMHSINQESDYIFQLEQQIVDLRNEIQKQVMDQQLLNNFHSQNSHQILKPSKQLQSRNTIGESKKSHFNKFSYKNQLEDQKSTMFFTKGNSIEHLNRKDSGSSREFLGLISREGQYEDRQKSQKQISDRMENDQCENLETTQDCNVQKANNFIIQEEGNADKKNYISSFLMGGETVEERFSVSESQNVKTFTKSLISASQQIENQNEGENLNKTASDSEEDRQECDNSDQQEQINKLQQELLQAYQKEKSLLEQFQIMNRKTSQLEQLNGQIQQKNKKYMVEIANLNQKLDQIMNILSSKQICESQPLEDQNEKKQDANLFPVQFSNTKKLSFSQIDCQDNNLTEEYQSQNFEDQTYMNLIKENTEEGNQLIKQNDQLQEEIQCISQMQTIEEEDVQQEDSRGNALQISRADDNLSNNNKSQVQSLKINQKQQSRNASNYQDVYVLQNIDNSPIQVQKQLNQNRWDSIKLKSIELKNLTESINFIKPNLSNKSHKIIPVVQLKLEDFSNNYKQLQMSAPISQKKIFIQSHKKTLFLGKNRNRSYKDLNNQLLNKQAKCNSQKENNYFEIQNNGLLTSRSQEIGNQKLLKGQKRYIQDLKNEENTFSIADEKEGNGGQYQGYLDYLQADNSQTQFFNQLNNYQNNVSFNKTLPKNYAQNNQNNLSERLSVTNSSFYKKALQEIQQTGIQNKGQKNQQKSENLSELNLKSKYNTQNINQNLQILPNLIADLPKQELDQLYRMFISNSQQSHSNFKNINLLQRSNKTYLKEICLKLNDYIEKIQHQEEMEDLKLKFPTLIKQLHMMRQQEIIKQHKLHQIENMKRYQSIQTPTYKRSFPELQSQSYFINLKANDKQIQQKADVSKSLGESRIPFSRTQQNYYSSRQYQIYDDNQFLKLQQNKVSDTSKQSLVAAELESDKGLLNQNSNSHIKHIQPEFSQFYLQDNNNFKQLNFSFQEKEANELNSQQFQDMIIDKLFDNNQFFQEGQKSVFQSFGNAQNYNDNNYQSSYNQNFQELNKNFQNQHFQKCLQKHPNKPTMAEIAECTFEENTLNNLTNVQEQSSSNQNCNREAKQIVNKNKIINHFYNNVQMMDIAPQTCAKANYYSINSQIETQNNIMPVKRNNAFNYRWQSNSHRRRGSQLFFNSEKQYNHDKHNNLFYKNNFLHKQYNSVGSSLQLKNNRDNNYQKQRGSVLCLLTGKYQQRTSEINNKDRAQFQSTQKQILQLFPKNLHERQKHNGASSFQIQNDSSMSVQENNMKIGVDNNSIKTFYQQ